MSEVSCESKEDKKITLLLNQHDELRDELKRRIVQRNNFAIQFVAAVAAILAISCGVKNYEYINVLFLLPIITAFYAVRIFSSYRVSERLVEFMCHYIEPQIAKCIDEDKPEDILWESFCEKDRKISMSSGIGIQKGFFQTVLFLVPIISFLLYSVVKGTNVFTIIYFSVCMIVGMRILITDRCAISYAGLNKLALCDYTDKKPRTDETTKAVFFDRDGTLHVDKVMTHKISDLELLPGAKDIVKRAHESGYKVIIVTNQSAIGKGYYSIHQMHLFNFFLRIRLKYIDAIYYCPHTVDAECRCRKPDTGMFERAAKEFNINLADSIIIGDRMSDIKAGANAGISKRVFVTTGIYGSGGYQAEDGFSTIAHDTVNSLSEISLEK